MTIQKLHIDMRDTICMIVLAVTFTGFMKVLAFVGTIWTLINAYQKTKHDVEEFHNGSWKDYFKTFFKTKDK